MRAVVQRVTRAEVRVAGEVVGRIGAGLLVLVGVGKSDTPETGQAFAEKIVNLRIFADEQGRMNRSLLETEGGVLAVSQFTLYGDCRKGRRPSYIDAAPPEVARALYDDFVRALRKLLPERPVESGQFQAMMEVDSINDGPVTLLLDSDRLF